MCSLIDGLNKTAGGGTAGKPFATDDSFAERISSHLVGITEPRQPNNETGHELFDEIFVRIEVERVCPWQLFVEDVDQGAEKIASPEYGGNKTVAAMRCYKIFIKYTGERCGISGGVEGKIRHKRSVSGYLGII